MRLLDHSLAQLDRLAAFDGGPFPVLSVYLDLRADSQGREHVEPWLRKELSGRIRTFRSASPGRRSLEEDANRIRVHVADLRPSRNGLVLFSCSGAGLFEAVELAGPTADNRMYVSNRPQLYELARLIDEYPRYAVVLADTQAARIFVCAANHFERSEEVAGIPTHRHKMGGWSQARYQRHVDNFHLRHAKEVAETLDRIVRHEGIRSIVLAGDDVIVPLLRDQLPKNLTERIVDVLALDIQTPERQILETTLEAMRRKDTETDRERVDELLGAYRANGLACIGVEDTKRALELGEVDELIISATPGAAPAAHMTAGRAIGQAGRSDESLEMRRALDALTANSLVAQAHRTGATIRFIEDASLLAPAGGVGAVLRFKA